MQWRHTTKGLDHQQLSMGLRKLGWRVSFGSESNHSGWHQHIFQILPVIIGISALATTLLLGSFLWGLVSKRKPKKYAAFSDLYPSASHKPNTVLALREFAKPIPSSSPKVADYINNAYFDTLVFDAEQGYEQVVTTEARSHTAFTHERPPAMIPPVKLSQVFSDPQHQWLPRSASARSHNFLEDMEAVTSQNNQDVKSRNWFKSPKSWKRLLFWKRSKTSNKFEFNINGAVYSSCSTPLHYIFMSSKTRATVAPGTPNNASKKQPIPKRSMSGPLYTDGSPLTPNRMGRSFSGPLSGCSTPARDGLIDSPYIPLEKLGTRKACPSPLYIT